MYAHPFYNNWNADDADTADFRCLVSIYKFNASLINIDRTEK